jgi:hypothetical protein
MLPAESLFEIFGQRHEHRSTIVTSNLPFEEWTSVFGNQRLTGALLDCLILHVHILESVFSPNRVRVRLYWPAVCSSKSTLCSFRKRLKFGSWPTTPIEPMMAKGAAMIAEVRLRGAVVKLRRLETRRLRTYVPIPPIAPCRAPAAASPFLAEGTRLELECPGRWLLTCQHHGCVRDVVWLDKEAVWFVRPP